MASVGGRYPGIFRGGTASAPGYSHLHRNKRALFPVGEAISYCVKVAGLLPLGNGWFERVDKFRGSQANGLCSQGVPSLFLGKFQQCSSHNHNLQRTLGYGEYVHEDD